MRRASKYFIILLVVATIISVPAVLLASQDTAYNEDRQIEAGAMTGDILLARPLGIVATVVGFGVFVISAPFSALGGNIGEAWHVLVTYPAEFTFARPLGDFD